MLKVYGLKVSYFTGKLEAYLRYKEIPYEYRSMSAEEFSKTIPEKTGAMQMPAAELPDGRWMTDTSPMIEWLESEHPQHPILPDDPAQTFVCHLIEDYADEWLWRPAMHFRWSYPASAKLLARQIIDEAAPDLRAPRRLARWRIENRQRRNFVARDGVSDATKAHVEGSYLRLLDLLTNILEQRPFVLGARPTLADIGLMGPLLRHFSMDPTPAAIMRETAPAVMEYVYRIWNAKASAINGPLIDGVPDDLATLLAETGATHLAALCANADAWSRGEKRHDATVEGVVYRDLQTSQYRVWCLEKLQRRFQKLDAAAKATVSNALGNANALEPLLRIMEPSSGYDLNGEAPFGKSIPVFAKIEG